MSARLLFGWTPPGGGLPEPKKECPSLVRLSVRAVCAPFFLDDERKEESKKGLSTILKRISDKKELKALLFCEFLEQGTLDRLFLSGFSSSKGGFLTHLDLTSTKVTNQSLSLVGSIRTLTVLILRSCGNFDDGGLSSLVRGGCASKLKMLDLSKCRKITDSGLSHLRSLVQLRTLDLSDLLITDTGVLELQQLTKLQQLSLSRTRAGDGALAAIARDFGGRERKRKGLLSLKVLKLRSLNLSEEGVLHLAHFPSLAIADLFGCWPSEDIWDEFHKQLQIGRKGCVVHRLTGKLLIGPEGVERSTIEKENVWKFPTNPHPEWNVRRLVGLLQGSGPSPTRPTPAFTPPPQALHSPFPSPFGSPIATGVPFRPPSLIHSRFMQPKKLLPSQNPTTSPRDSPMTPASIPKQPEPLPNRLCLKKPNNNNNNKPNNNNNNKSPIPKPTSPVPKSIPKQTKPNPSTTTKKVTQPSTSVRDKQEPKPLQEKKMNGNQDPDTRKRTRKSQSKEKQENAPSQKKRRCVQTEGENDEPPPSLPQASTRKTTRNATKKTPTPSTSTKPTTTKPTRRTTKKDPELQAALLRSQTELERIRRVIAERNRG